MSDRTKDTIRIICDYFLDNPDDFNCRKKDISDPNSILGKKYISDVVDKYLNEDLEIKNLKTISDSLVSSILELYYGHDEKSLKLINKSHRESMAIENSIGNFLERYIFDEGYHYGWFICPGNLVKSIDFIKKNDDKWIKLQVKNRDNSENSSSAAIRNNTDIIKWHRSFAYKDGDNWSMFPDDSLSKKLSEDGFMAYILKNLKPLS